MADLSTHAQPIWMKVLQRKTNLSNRKCLSHKSIAESFKLLDMKGAVKDTRRFNYVCKLLQLLLRRNFHNLTASAQKVIVDMLENVLEEVIKTENNKKTLQILLDDLANALEKGQHSHYGSRSLWQQHGENHSHMQQKLNKLEITPRRDDGGLMITDLPPDCLREICDRIADHEDLLNVAHVDKTVQALTQDYVIWKRLCHFHFDRNQIKDGLTFKGNTNNCDWKELYFRLLKRYGRRETYAEMLSLCRHCKTLFWELHGHRCSATHGTPSSVQVTPMMCVEIFTA